MAVALGILTAASASVAGEPSIAEQLFLEGKALMREKQYASACEKFKASHDLDPTATGTLLNLATCHELTNKPATAWAEFRRVAAESVGHQDDRVATARWSLAEEHARTLFPTLSYLSVKVSSSPGSGLELRLDGGLIDRASWGVELPVDPGNHVVEASAPGKLPGRFAVAIGPNSDHRWIAIPPLRDAPRAPAAGGADTRTRVIGLAIGGAGVAAIGVALAFGGVAQERGNKANALCPSAVCADAAIREEASTKLASAHSAATVANVLAIGGVLALASGIVILLASSSAKVAPTSRPLQFARALVSGGGVLIGGEL